MITILIAQDEERIRKIFTQVLRQEGYIVPENGNQDNVIRVIKKEEIKDIAQLKDTVIKLEDSVYKEKQGVLYRSVLEAIERPLIEHTLERTEGNQLKAARILGINRNTIRAKIKRLSIDVEKWKT